MKVIFLPKWYPNEENYVSGIFVQEFAKTLSSFCNLRVLHVYRSNFNPYMKREYKNANIMVFQVCYKSHIASFFIYNFLATRYLFNLARKDPPDLLHVHIFSAGIPAIITKWLFGIPFVVTEHYEISDFSSGRAYPKLTKFSLRLRSILARAVFNRANALINVSKYMESSIESLGVQTPSFVVPNAVDASIFYYSKRGSEHRKINRILFVGSLSQRKGLDIIFKAVQSLKARRSNFVIEMIGNGYMKASYKKRARDMLIHEHLRFHGIKQKPEVAEFMRICDFLILPSYWENFPCVILESLCCGLPVIGTNVGGIPEIINESNGIIIPPGNPELLVKAMEKMFGTSNNYDREAISNNAIELYSRSIGKRLFSIYNHVLNFENGT